MNCDGCMVSQMCWLAPGHDPAELTVCGGENQGLGLVIFWGGHSTDIPTRPHGYCFAFEDYNGVMNLLLGFIPKVTSGAFGIIDLRQRVLAYTVMSLA